MPTNGLEPQPDDPRATPLPAEPERQRNEQMLLASFELSPDAVLIVNRRGVIVRANSQAESVFGYARDELLDKPIEVLIPQPLRERHVLHRTDYVTHPRMRPMGTGLELYGRRCGGDEIPIEVSLSPLHIDGELLILGVVRDISDRKRIEDALQDSERRFASAFEFAAIGMALVSREGRWLKVNQAVCALVGYTAEELLGKTFQDITHPADLNSDLEHVRQMLAGEIQTYQMEKRYFHRSGAVVWVLLSVSLVRDAAGNPLYFLSQIQDIGARKRVEDALRRQNGELAALSQLGQALSRLAQPTELLEVIYTVIGQILDNRNLYIALYNQANQMIAFPVYTIDGQRISRPDRPWSNGLTEYVIRTKEPLWLPQDVEAGSRARGVEPRGRPSRCFLAVPLLVGEKVLGVIAIQDYEHEAVYDRGHLEVLSTIAAQAAIALENAQLFAETEQLARMDALTGIANRRYLFEVGARELSRARRFGHPLSALMLDIDHFKHVNDTYGHATGDQVLQTLSRMCQQHVRDIDIVGRYGGEEFVILLVETDTAGARRSAERLRAQIAQMVTETDQSPVSVTVSLGVAGAQMDSDGFASLLVRADSALYAAKQAGRNRVEVG